MAILPCTIKKCEEDGTFRICRGQTGMVRLCHTHLKRFVKLKALKEHNRYDFKRLVGIKTKEYKVKK